MDRPGAKGTKQEWIEYAEELGADLNRAVDDLNDGRDKLEQWAEDLEAAELSRLELVARLEALEALEAKAKAAPELVAAAGSLEGVAEFRKVRTESAERYQRVRALENQVRILRDKLTEAGVL